MHPPHPKNEWRKTRLKIRLFENETENKQAKIIEHPFLS